MKTRLIRIGNSRGIRLPKPLIDEVGLVEDVELEVRADALVIRASHGPRPGWAEAAAELAASSESGLLDAPTPTRFDDADWTW
jgi:antitoxin MazE